jgi:hypothetical protein
MGEYYNSPLGGLEGLQASLGLRQWLSPSVGPALRLAGQPLAAARGRKVWPIRPKSIVLGSSEVRDTFSLFRGSLNLSGNPRDMSVD